MRTIHLYGSSSRCVMGNTFGKETARILLKHVLPRSIADVEAELGAREAGPAPVYSAALRAIVSTLLSARGFEPTPDPLSVTDRERASRTWIRDHLGPLDPIEVGKLYEYARGFTLDEPGAAERRIVRSAGAKRNQGLFYTPEAIVRHIVSKTLDALEIKGAQYLLDLRLLDPAVGTGLFLVEALEQLTDRILVFRRSGDRLLVERIKGLKEGVAETLRSRVAAAEISDEVAVRIHLATTCLYGVDLDPVAVAISRAALWEAAAKELPFAAEITMRIRTGNSLIGKEGGSPTSASVEDENLRHAPAYFGTRNLDTSDIAAWVTEKAVLHWPQEYPEVFDRNRPGFDAIVGNPPYEIMSVKESGIEERRREQAYFRRTYRTCSGKINTYRLMLERSLTLLRAGGALGFIVPATLLADASASRLRTLILDESEILQAVIVPEKARAFKGVTQAYLVLVARKGSGTQTLSTVVWNGRGEVSGLEGVKIAVSVLDKTDSRIPILRSSEEKAMLEALLAHPPLRGDGICAPVGKVHQGEMNMTTHRRFLSANATGHCLVRGEHIEPFQVAHPSRRPGRWDWVADSFFNPGVAARRVTGNSSTDRGAAPWSHPRIVLGRVVNMGTSRRLKAALVPPGTLLGDMTNYICDLSLTSGYLLGLLNSRLLNWRIKLTSTNNYLSAAEVEALPIPRVTPIDRPVPSDEEMQEILVGLTTDPRSQSLEGSVRLVKPVLPLGGEGGRAGVLVKWIEHLADRLSSDPGVSFGDKRESTVNVLDALVVELYRVDSLVKELADHG